MSLPYTQARGAGTLDDPPCTHEHHADLGTGFLCILEAKGDYTSTPERFLGCVAASTNDEMLLSLGMTGETEALTSALLSLKPFLSQILIKPGFPGVPSAHLLTPFPVPVCGSKS